MATAPAHLIAPSPEVRDELRRRGGDTAQRCFQCATCSAVCSLAPDERPFPRRQMLMAQWGLIDRLAADPAVWLCHQCNDCTVRCPRNARPGDVLQAVRSMVVERLATPAWMGRLVGKARSTWPVLLGTPILFWVVLLGLTGHLAWPAHVTAFEQVVPHLLIYSVFLPVATWVLAVTFLEGGRFWAFLGSSGPPRKGSFLGALLPVLGEIGTHRRFADCEAARPRRTGHLLLMWGFVGAAVTSGLLVIALYGFGSKMPLPLGHPFKILGNVSAVLLVAGVTVLSWQRLARPEVSGSTTAFDTFFLTVVLLVIATGVLSEIARFALPGSMAGGIYVAHLSFVLTLFLTFPYSKFAHVLYRTLAMTHERMTRAD
ncbi:MAG TPA: hypothetical protein ENK19_01795 [Acidobacteria bacterium]|nr:hypothetical protein [Acidobacteriota bacterium]